LPRLCLAAAGLFLLLPRSRARAAEATPRLKPRARADPQTIAGLRALPDDERTKVTKQLALEIRKLPADEQGKPRQQPRESGNRRRFRSRDIAGGNDDPGGALRERPGQSAERYAELAQLVRYEHMRASLDNPQMAAAVAKLEADDRDRQQADFTLADLKGNKWTLKELRGKVVLVNFWATWCPPCRKEMPDLDALYRRFEKQGFVILAISDEETAKVTPFLAAHGVAYPILLDPGER